MKFFRIIVAALFTLVISDAYAQQDLRTNGLTLVNGTGGTLSLSFAGTGSESFTFPDNGPSFMPAGTSNSQTLSWNGSEWQVRNNLLNDGSNITLPTGNLTINSGNLIFDNGTLYLIHDGVGSAGWFELDNTSASGCALCGTTSGTGPAVSGFSYGAATAIDGGSGFGYAGHFYTSEPLSTNPTVFSENFGASHAGEFEIDNGANASSVINALTNGTGHGVTITINNATSNGNGVEATTNGLGSAGYFEITNGASDAAAVHGSSVGSSQGAGVYGESTNGSGVHGFSNGISGVLGESSTSHGVQGQSTSGAGVYGTSTNSHAGAFHITHAANATTALDVLTNGTGDAGTFTISNNTSSAHALYGTSDGSVFGSGVYGSNTGAGVGVRGTSTNGFAGYFLITNTSSTGTVGSFVTDGLGRAGEFYIANSLNNTVALDVSTDGTGSAAEFSVDNASSINDAVRITALGTGAALYAFAAETAGRFSGAVGVQVDAGSLIGSTTTIASGATIPADVITVLISDDGGGTASALIPATGTEGQIIYATTNDADGLQIGTSSVVAGKVITLLYVGGSWKTAP